MSPHPITRFSNLDVVVIGDTVVDEWLSGISRRLCREAPVPVVEVTASESAPGGAANAAANVAALGARVRYFSIVGDDGPGRRLRSALSKRGIDGSGVLVDSTRHTTVKRRLTTHGQVVARFDHLDRRPWDARGPEELARLLRAAAIRADLVLVCDYDDGVCGGGIRRAVAEIRPTITCPLVIDAHSVLRWSPCRPTAVTPSADEVSALIGSADGTGYHRDPASALRLASATLLRRTNAAMVVTTMDADGTLLHLPGRTPHRTFPAVAAPQSHTTGAGDTFTAAFAMALASAIDPVTAAEIAQRAADVVVAKPRTAVCSLTELVGRCGDTTWPDPVAEEPAEPREAPRGDEILATGY